MRTDRTIIIGDSTGIGADCVRLRANLGIILSDSRGQIRNLGIQVILSGNQVVDGVSVADDLRFVICLVVMRLREHNQLSDHCNQQDCDRDTVDDEKPATIGTLCVRCILWVVIIVLTSLVPIQRSLLVGHHGSNTKIIRRYYNSMRGNTIN